MLKLGAAKEIKVNDLVYLIKELIAYERKVKGHSTKPDGQPGHCLDTSKAEHGFGFEARTNLREGLEKTIEWYVKNG